MTTGINLVNEPQLQSLRGRALQLKREMHDARRLGVLDDDELAEALLAVDLAVEQAFDALSPLQLAEELRFQWGGWGWLRSAWRAASADSLDSQL